MALFGELFLSDILNKPVLDQAGEELGRLKDLSIVKGEPLPKVDSVIIRKKRDYYKVRWADMNLFNRRIMSAELMAMDLVHYEYAEDDLLAARDMLDKQIVDVDGAKVVRVNDIKLEGFKADAVVVAVDVGMRGILRRLGVERLGEDILRILRVELPLNLISWNYMQPLQPKLTTISLTVPRQMVAELHPADLADLISQVSHDEGAQFIQHLDVETAAEAIAELEPDAQTAIITDMSSKRAADIIGEMAPDAAADILNTLPPEKARELLDHIEKEDAEDIQELLSHESDTAGGLMTNEFVYYPPDITIGELIERFRKDAPEIESVYYIYAVDDEDRLHGVASLKEILVSDPGARLSDIMEKNIKSVKPDEDEAEVARTISKYNLVALPVVDVENRFIGIVTIDDIVDKMLPRGARRRRV